MNVEEKIENLFNRINNNDFDFSDEDSFLIRNSPKLRDVFLKKFAHNDISSFNEKIWNDTLSDLLGSFSINNYTKEEIDVIFINATKLCLKTGYQANFVENLSDLYKFDVSLKEKISKIVEDFICNPNNHFENIMLGEEEIYELLKYKRYDVIVNLSKDKAVTISDDLYEKIKNECPYDKYPEILKKHEIKNGTYIYSLNNSIEELIDGYEEIVHDLKDSNSIQKNDSEMTSLGIQEKLENLKSLIYQKILSEENLDYLNAKRDIRVVFFGFYHPIFSFSDRVEIAKILYDRNCLAGTEILLQNEIITPEEEIEKTKNLLYNGYKSRTDRLLAMGIKNFEDDRVLYYLVHNGQLDYVIKFFPEEIITKNIPLIVQGILGNSSYDDYCEVDIHLEKYPKIFKALIDNGKINRINLRCIGDDPITNQALIEAVTKTPYVQFSNSLNYLNKDEFKKILFLVDQGFINLLSRNFVLSPDNFRLNKDFLIPKLLEDVPSICHFIYLHFDLVLEYKEELLFKLLGNPIVTEKILDKINHDENFDYLYNNDIFNYTKNYYAKKYNLKLEHFDKMEKHFGPKILRYIENNSLHTLINLDDDEFEKLLGLFPKVKYEISDLESAYESIVQRLFGESRTDEISVFPNLLHAIQDKNENEIIKIKEELIVFTKKETFEKIKEKYQLTNIQTIEELLNLIISKLSASENEYYTNILHEITNAYIRDARNYFHDNFIFDSLDINSRSNLYHDIAYSFSLSGNVDDRVNSLIKEVCKKLDNDFIKKIRKDYDFSDNLDAYDILNHVVQKLKDPNERIKYLPLLKEVTDYHHDVLKKENPHKNTLEWALDLDYDLEQKNLNNEIKKHFIINSSSYLVNHSISLQDCISSELEKLGIPRSLTLDIIAYYSGERNFNQDIKDIQKNIGLLVQISNKIITQNTITDKNDKLINYQKISKELDRKGLVRRIYKAPESEIDIYQVLLNLNLDLIRENLFQNEEMYDKLVDIMKKKKLHVLPEKLKRIWKSSESLPDNLNNIYGFVNYFVPILESERKRLTSAGKNPEDSLTGLSSILVQADTYSSVSSVFSQILGSEDARLIQSNPKDNAATRFLENNGRLKEAIKFTINNYKRQKVTVPTFDEEFTLNDENKKLEIIVGNFTAPSNLTHGERTGACMRIGGAGDSLFRFCLSNPNGFHIRFEEPSTHEYISRVSGFRNGNTVFLNELRFSCNTELYSNSDVVEACRLAAKRLIELSKDSTCPIENVVITNQYAMRETNDDVVYLEIQNNKEGFPHFYSDIGSNGIVLATTAKDKPFVPIDFDKKKVPNYQPVRSKIRFLKNSSELFSGINRVASIKSILDGVNYENLDSFQFSDGLIYGIISDDWYIYLDSNLGIYYDFIEIDPRAKEECAEHLAIIEEMIQNNEIERDDEYVL